jgi:hypothetical protein
MTRSLSVLPFFIAHLSPPAVTSAASHLDDLQCKDAMDNVCRDAPASLAPQLLCPLCSASETLTQELRSAHALTCDVLSLLPLLPRFPLCGSRFVANDSPVRL